MGDDPRYPTAPRDVIGDDGDLRIMRDALREGKYVALAPNGKVYVSKDVETPMTPANEAFIEGKLGQIVELARSGFGVNVHPNGEISAHHQSGRHSVVYDPDPALSQQQRGLLERGIAEGASVRVHADGRVEYHLPEGRGAVDPYKAGITQHTIKQEIDSGRLAAAQREGKALIVEPDGTAHYGSIADGPAGFEFPEDGASPDDPFDTAAELAAEARSLDLGAGAARILSQEDFVAAQSAATANRDVAARSRASAEATASAADAQGKDATTAINTALDAGSAAARNARDARQRGDERAAAEFDEEAQRYADMARVAARQKDGAETAATTARAEAATHATREAEAERAVARAETDRAAREAVYDHQEEQAALFQQAADEMGQAEKLEAGLLDFDEVRFPAEAQNVRDAAAAARAKAQELTDRARAMDGTSPSTPTAPPPGPGSPFRTHPPIHDDLSSADPTGADTIAVAAADAVATDLDSVAIDPHDDVASADSAAGSVQPTDIEPIGPDPIELQSSEPEAIAVDAGIDAVGTDQIAMDSADLDVGADPSDAESGVDV